MTFTVTPAQTLAGRFRVVRFCGRGGMGEVFEVEDLELGIPVALKIIRPDAAVEADVLARFRREILLARKVTHPNVCRIFDVFHHRVEPSGGGPETELIFLTMELLRGETLAERLRRFGRMTTAEVLPVARQMVAALEAAHAAGIVHRDFKSANVILVENGGGVRAVVTDFGLARSLAPDDGSGISSSGRMVGTSAYMAPEQVEGGEVTPATDVYSLGVVLYEMVCGTKPFLGDTPLDVAMKRLKERPRPPRSHVPELDPRWEAAILRCLERDPADRFAAASDVVKALTGEDVGSYRRVLAGGGRRRSALTAAAMAVTVVAGAGLFAAMRTPRASPAAATAPAMRRSVALVGFKNLSGRPETAWMSTAFAEMLASELAASEKLRTIPGENVARMRTDLALADADSLSRQTLALVRANLGSDVVVLGSYLALGRDAGGRIRLDLRIQDTAQGETIASLVEEGTEAELFDLVSRTGARLRARLGVADAASRPAVVAETPTTSAEALRLYSEGLQLLRRLDALGARDHLQKAVEVDPGYAQAHAALAEAWATLGYDRKAEEAARRAVDLSATLSREERLWIEGRHSEAAHRQDQAVGLYRTLWSFFPDNLEYGLRLAAAETAAGKQEEALATIADLRKLPLPAAADPRIDLAEAEVASTRSDFRRMHTLAAKAAEKGLAQHSRLLVARARALDGWALQNVGETSAAFTAFEEARAVSNDVHDPAGAARAILSIAMLRWGQGDVALTKKMSEEALAIFRDIGNRKGSASTITHLGGVAWREGKLDEAQRLWEDALAIYRELGDRSSVARVLNNLAVVMEEGGDLPGALKRHQDVLAMHRELGEQRSVPKSLNNIGDILREQGDLEGADKSYAEALAINQQNGQKSDMARNLYSIAEVHLARGDLAEARKKDEEVLAILTGLGRELFAPEARLALARIAVEEGRLAEAEAAARQAADAFAAKKVPDSEAVARSVLAEALAGQDRRADARAAMARAVALANKSQTQTVRLSVAIASARLAAAGSAADRRQASLRLNQALAEARKSGRLGLQYEARLALGEIDLSSGRPDGSRRLQLLEEEASSRGFGLIARRALSARQGGAARSS